MDRGTSVNRDGERVARLEGDVTAVSHRVGRNEQSISQLYDAINEVRLLLAKAKGIVIGWSIGISISTACIMVALESLIKNVFRG